MKQIKPCNPESLPCVQSVLDYFARLEANGIILGQHTQTIPQEELARIHEITGKLPALCGFELLAYSPNINKNTLDDDHCIHEINANENTLQTAFEWAEKHGLITFTWHWFSPLYGNNKSFYARNTDFDARKAVIAGTPENTALLSDMDAIAEILAEFRDKNIPILWRPFHEADGDWFWWGKHGADTAKKLWLIMFDRYVNLYKLNNLIWVWNAPLREYYPGDEYCDIISRDIYPKEHEHTDLAEKYHELMKITDIHKPSAIGEIGSIPSIEMLSKTRIPWLWFMMWSGEFALSEKHTTGEEFIKAYNHDYAVTLDKLPKLY
ncbi:MAG: glycoside hydrolase family 26 protein [Oscillospiraceae bacterium]|nr:glycoside hydrolase family 26 protein [Oscillospiraceae bacterium]